MTLKFHPEPGTILICDYSTGFKAPEMVKKRPVVTVSPRLKRRDGLVTVVPLSTSRPEPVCLSSLLHNAI
ncbi:type II toxin-antitoxin system PemK/MazF family toxin [Rhodopseudomonas palustris]|uniref:type II toxin-antitoxin system PemK/MazF family toxin n=1 Tax=Rhodopseudomonas palustris TaxID=1076 RepID=UPI001AECC495